jgi:hypothetical protein
MDLRDSFTQWLSLEIGSTAIPALRQYLRDRNYRLLSIVENSSRWQRDVYHPDRGFFRAIGSDDQEALLGILRQIWLVDALIPVST